MLARGADCLRYRREIGLALAELFGMRLAGHLINHEYLTGVSDPGTTFVGIGTRAAAWSYVSAGGVNWVQALKGALTNATELRASRRRARVTGAVPGGRSIRQQGHTSW